MQSITEFYHNLEEPTKGCLLALRDIILKQDENITNELKYGMPFFLYKGKMFCYLWVHKKFKHPYIGIVEGNRLDHPDLILEKRARMKIFLIDPNKDIPITIIQSILEEALSLYKSGFIKTPRNNR